MLVLIAGLQCHLTQAIIHVAHCVLVLIDGLQRHLTQLLQSNLHWSEQHIPIIMYKQTAVTSGRWSIEVHNKCEMQTKLCISHSSGWAHDWLTAITEPTSGCRRFNPPYLLTHLVIAMQTSLACDLHCWLPMTTKPNMLILSADGRNYFF